MQVINSGGRRDGQAAVRLFFVDEKSGQPVAGLVVSLLSNSARAADSLKAAAAPAGGQRQHLATLQTDHAGYVSFKLDRATAAAYQSLAVRHGAARGDALSLNVADLLAGRDTYTVSLDASGYTASPTTLGLPSILSPDPQDAAVSPGSVGLTPRLLPGRGLCGQLTPTLFGVKRFEAFQILPDNICNPLVVDCPAETAIVRGRMLEYEIAWNPCGTALGELLNTFTLAPCEQVNVAVLDWMHSETSTLTQTSDLRQQSYQEMNHDRLIAETMQSSANSKSKGWAIGGAVSGGMSIPFKNGMKLDVSSVFGGSYSNQSQTQSVALNTTSRLSDNITQSATLVASSRSTAVFQTTASERQTLQTRTVRNHNHCHTLTLMYYQVNRNYRVVTEYKGQRDVFLVRYDNKEFDARRAYCNAELLKEVLLDRSLLGCFDELADALFCCGVKKEESGPPPPPAEKVLMDSLTLTVKPKEVIGGGLLTIHLYSATGTFPLSTVSAYVSPPWQPGGIHTQTFNLPNTVDPAQVAWIQIYDSAVGNPVKVTLNELKLTYHVVNDGNYTLYSTQTQVILNPELRTPVTPELPGQQQQPPASTPEHNECVEKSCCIRKLLGHLNCHKRYYNSILWLNEDPNERVMRWSCCRGETVEPFSLIAQIENDPVGVYGDFLVFPVADSQLTDDPSVPPSSRLVTMPTPGVYLEGVMGQCVTCEKIDPDRFWDWQTSPCLDNAAEVSGLTPTGGGGAQANDLKAETISNLINFTSPPDAPGSILKDLLSELLTKAEGGNTTATDLLGKLLDTLKESLGKKG